MRRKKAASLTCAFLLLTPLAFGCPSDAAAQDSGERDTLAAMAEQHRGETPEETPFAAENPRGEIGGETVIYAELEGTQIEGYLAHPPGGGEEVPGIIVIQEWWGLNENIRAITRRLAAEGYLALAVDLYEGEVAEDSDTARKLMMASLEKSSRLEENLRQAHSFLEQSGAGKIGVIGWCFGGGWSLRTALLLPDEIDATVIYYGRLVTDRAELAALRSPILGIFGELDRGIPVDTVREFKAVLEELGKPASIHIFQGADHAFANPSGGRYDALAASEAWSLTLDFFATLLQD